MRNRRAGRRAGRHAARRAVRRAATRTAGWLARPSGRLGIVGALTVGVVVTVTPANGAASDIASHVASAMRQLVAKPSQNGLSINGTPAVGALFTSSHGKLGTHFCTASVVNSPAGDLAITAAHCVTGVSGTILFVPGYHSGDVPYGTWVVSKVYVDQAWSSSQSQDDDVAFLKVSQAGSSVPIEDVTGAETLATNTPVPQMVEVIGYPDGASQPIACENRISQPQPNQLEFDCGGYTDGTSGGPFLTHVSPATGQGIVIGVIGGLDQGGYTSSVSYSIEFGQNVAQLYATAIAGG
jgi:V8-like Glu-specific endopeptidase